MAIWAIIFVISYHTYHVKAQTSRPKFEIWNILVVFFTYAVQAEVAVTGFPQERWT
jgi:hypothetical protein